MKRLVLIIVLFFVPALFAQGSHFILNDFGTLTITGNTADSLKVAFMDTSFLRAANKYKQSARFTGAATLFLYADTSADTVGAVDTAGTYTLSARRLDDQLESEIDTVITLGSAIAWDAENAARPRIFDIHTDIGIVGYYFYITRAGASGVATFRFSILYQQYNK